MKNRILHLTRTIIPYVKELMPLTQSVTGCLLMQQLDYWFERQPDGFFKFLEPAPDHPNYRHGDSWCEELGISRAQFRTAFEAIGTIYRSKSEFDKSTDKFQGRFYCSFYDRRRQLTFYYRNHELVDQALDALICVNSGSFSPHSGGNSPEITVREQPSAPVIQQPSITGIAKSETTVTRDPISPVSHHAPLTVEEEPLPLTEAKTSLHEDHMADFQEGEVSPLLVSDTTCQKSPQQQTTHSSDEQGSGSSLIYPKGITKVEVETLCKLLRPHPVELQQQVLDEIEGARAKGTLKSGAVPFGRYLASAIECGQFVPNLGIAILGARQRREEAAQKELAAAKISPVTDVDAAQRRFASLPVNLQRSLAEMRDKIASQKSPRSN